MPGFATRRTAFTLIELLAVITIIGILVAIIIPTVSKVRGSARRAQCASNLRQIVLASISYGNDNRGKPPYSYMNESQWDNDPNRMLGSHGYKTCFAPYLGDQGETAAFLVKVMFDPGAASQNDTYNPAIKGVQPLNEIYYISYSYFNSDKGLTTDGYDRRRLFSNLNNPPLDVAMWGCLSKSNANGTIGHYENTSSSGDPIKGMNAAYADGSVKWVEFGNMEKFSSVFYWPRPKGNL
jgi:general secretion pathway protein G